MKVLGGTGWVSEVGNHEVSPELREVKPLSVAVGSDGVKGFLMGTGFVFAHS